MQLEKEAPKSASSRLALGQDARQHLAGRRGALPLLLFSSVARGGGGGQPPEEEEEEEGQEEEEDGRGGK